MEIKILKQLFIDWQFKDFFIRLLQNFILQLEKIEKFFVFFQRNIPSL